MTAQELNDMQYLLGIMVEMNRDNGIDLPPGEVVASGVLLYMHGSKKVLSEMAAIAYDEARDPVVGNA